MEKLHLYWSRELDVKKWGYKKEVYKKPVYVKELIPFCRQVITKYLQL